MGRKVIEVELGLGETILSKLQELGAKGCRVGSVIHKGPYLLEITIDDSRTSPTLSGDNTSAV